METTPRSTSGSTSRRALMKGAAWATPVVALSVAAPALATSACIAMEDWEATEALRITPDPSTNVSGNKPAVKDWVMTRDSGNAPVVWYQAAYWGGAPDADGALNEVAVLINDPGNNVKTVTTLESQVLCLGAGTYTFSFNARFDQRNHRPLRLRADIFDETTGAKITPAGAPVDAETESIPTSSSVQYGDLKLPYFQNSYSIQITLEKQTEVRFRYTWSADHLSTRPRGEDQWNGTDDIAVTAPVVQQTA